MCWGVAGRGRVSSRHLPLAPIAAGACAIPFAAGSGQHLSHLPCAHPPHSHICRRPFHLLQALAVCEWMDREKQDCAAIILCGDFNGPPHESFHALLRRLGYVSAHVQRHGREPQASLRTACRVLPAAWLGLAGPAGGMPAQAPLPLVLMLPASPAQLGRLRLTAATPAPPSPAGHLAHGHPGTADGPGGL